MKPPTRDPMARRRSRAAELGEEIEVLRRRLAETKAKILSNPVRAVLAQANVLPSMARNLMGEKP